MNAISTRTAQGKKFFLDILNSKVGTVALVLPLLLVSGCGTSDSVVGGNAAPEPEQTDLKPSGSEKKSGQAENKSINDSCSAEGDNNDIECSIDAPAYPRIAGVDLKFDFATLVFAGTPDELPVPPDFPASEVSGHCDDWHDWVIQQDDFYIGLPNVAMEMDTGIIEILKINDFEVNPTKRSEAPSNYTKIRCQHGAGSNYGHTMIADTRSRSVDLLGDTGEKKPIPPASLTLKQGESENASVIIVSNPGDLYEGVLNISAKVDGKEQPTSLGSPEVPIKWMGYDPNSGEDELLNSQGDFYDWSLEKKRWVKNPVVYQ